MKFNATHGMDFAAWFKTGVSYLSRTLEDRLIQQVEGNNKLSFKDKEGVIK